MRNASRIGFGLLVLFVLAAIPWTYLNIRWGRQLEAELAKLKAEGKPLMLQDLVPAPVPERENAAIRYQKVFQVRFDRPPPNADGVEFAGLSREDWATVERFVKNPDDRLRHRVAELLGRPETREALETLRLGSTKPHCLFPIRWQDLYAALLPHLSKFRQAAQAFAARALVSADERRVDEALADCETVLRMSGHVSGEPILISQSVGYAMQAVAFDALEVILDHTPLPPNAGDRLDSCLRQVDLRKSFAAALDSERCGLNSLFPMVAGRPGELASILGGVSGVSSVQRALLWLYATPLGQPVRKADQLAALRIISRSVAAADWPYYRSSRQLGALDDEVHSLPRYLVLTLVAVPILRPAQAKRDELLARIGLCRVVLALKQHRQEHGSYPANLGDLQQAPGRTLPQDPFAGRAFRYRRQKDGFLLYSVGPNLKDDGGVGPPPRAGLEGDLVWQCSG
jgi:hypothetical protein